MAKSNTEPLTTSFVIDRFESDKVVLVDGKEELIIAKKYFPKSIKEGDVVCLTLVTSEHERNHREKRIKDLLNDILNSK